MSDLKTKPTNKSVNKFLQAIDNERKRKDAFAISSLIEEASRQKAVLWGDSIVGFGTYHYQYESGREGKWPITGFSPRKTNFSIYIMPGFSQYQSLMEKLGKYKTGKCCLYINKLADVDLVVLRKLIERSVKDMKKKYNCS